MKEGCRNGVSLSEEALWEEPEGRAPLLGTLNDMLSKTGNERLFPEGPRFGGTGNDAPFLRPLREEKHLFI